MKRTRHLTESEIVCLEARMCSAEDWNRIMVAEDFDASFVHYVRFSGDIVLGAFHKVFTLAGGMAKHSGIYHATLHNVEIGDDCCIENVKNYIANYTIGDGTFIENVDIILTDGVSSFGNGVEVSVLNETGGREVCIYDRLSAQQAYVMALYRHRPGVISAMKRMIEEYAAGVSSDRGVIGSNVVIADAGYIKNVKVGDFCKIEGTARLKNGSINSNADAPVHIGVGVIGDDFIISSGSSVEDGVTFSRCFIGQSCRLGHTYSASDSLFFSNCQGENGEACAIFAGPFTVTHHKSTLLIAGMFSFMNAGSGSNQSNHMYKLGPIHQGIFERGAVEWFYLHVTGNRDITMAILEEAEKNNIPLSLAFALAYTESRYNVNAVNRNKNASIDRGLFQLNNRSFPQLEEDDFFNPAVSAKYGMSHLRFCMNVAGNEVTALAMYNAGTTKVRSNNTPQSTLVYVGKIMAYREKLDRLFAEEVSPYFDSSRQMSGISVAFLGNRKFDR